MVIDSSAICAMFLEEEGYQRIVSALETSSEPLEMSAVNLLETAVVLLRRKGPETVDDMFLFMQKLGVRIVDFTSAHVTAAYAAYRKYGKGLHPARLNLADVAAYITARENRRQPLLFIGDDFSRTDIEAAL